MQHKPNMNFFVSTVHHFTANP